jgi:photosystem II oxygen-evolving enhancer protein 1
MRFRALLVAFLALCLGVLTACSDAPSAVLNRNELTYDEILNTGLANKCPQISEFTRGTLPLERGKSYVVTDLCLEPQEYFVEVEPTNKRDVATFVLGKLLTRDTTSLEQMTATLKVAEDGVLTLKEEDGIDFQPVTVQLPGGERIPFFFTMKGFEGDFKVPSYRGAGFLDPKGRGVVTGYDNAVALPASADSEDFERANVKATELGKGTMSLQVTKVDASTGEFAGVFESEQPSDTDLGAKDAEEVKIRGTFYGRLEERA